MCQALAGLAKEPVSRASGECEQDSKAGRYPKRGVAQRAGGGSFKPCSVPVRIRSPLPIPVRLMAGRKVLALAVVVRVHGRERGCW